MKKFIKVGFEFTGSQAKGKRLPRTKLRSSGDSIYKVIGGSPTLSNYKWINDRIESDDCGIEVPTPIITDKKDITRYFNEFKTFALSNNIAIDINKARCALGGGHIHMNISDMKLSLRKLFLKNVGIFMSNNPQLNWGFNDVNDTWNANSLLSIPPSDSISTLFSSFYEFNIDKLAYVNGENTYICTPDGRIGENSKRYLYQFKHDRYPFRAFISDPLKVKLNKKFAIRYNDNYKTVEFRIFDMPKSLGQHLLHYDVATAIYNHCYKASVKKQLLKSEYTDYSQYKFTLEESIAKFDKTLKMLGISRRRTSAMRDNIRTRYDWTKISKEHNYLL